MYPVKVFKLLEDEAWEILEKRCFGSVITLVNGEILTSHVPFLCRKESGLLEFHLAVNNPMLKTFAGGNVESRLICHAGDAYVRPDWYDMANQVPTWNYVVAEVKGSLTLLSESKTKQHLVDISDRFERNFEQPWRIDKLTEKQLDTMMRAIRVFQLNTESLSGHKKMAQHKPLAAKQNLLANMSLNTEESLMMTLFRQHVEKES